MKIKKSVVKYSGVELWVLCDLRALHQVVGCGLNKTKVSVLSVVRKLFGGRRL
jgi:lipoate-protein ligase B